MNRIRKVAKNCKETFSSQESYQEIYKRYREKTAKVGRREEMRERVKGRERER
jgi:hypothetical protein